MSHYLLAGAVAAEKDQQDGDGAAGSDGDCAQVE